MTDFRDQAFDALGQVLRIYAEFTFDIDGESAKESKLRFRKWARHLTTGAAHPDSLDEAPAQVRDFRGIRAALGNHRKAEKKHVDHMVDVIWEMLSGLRDAFAKDRDDDITVGEQLDRLKAAAATGADVATLRSQVVKTVVVVQRSLQERRERHQNAMHEMGQKLRDLKNELADARHQAETDGLTDLFNRASFDQHLLAAAQLAEFTGEPLSVLMIDVDHFKKLNDAHGHRKGDEALVQIANAIVRVASRRTDFVARYGGEEMVVVLGDTPSVGAAKVAERVCEAIRKVKLRDREGGRIKVTASIGVATYAPPETPGDLIERADKALYHAKETGRNQFIISEHMGMDEKAAS